jgi:hypothetical protein
VFHTPSKPVLDRNTWRRVARPVLLLAVALRFASGTSAVAGERDAATRVQSVLDALRVRLGIAVPVRASLVTRNPLAFSVETPPAAGDAFVISIEAAYLDLLTEEELEAALAHELGHVWIFTHHPYLHTEQLANTIAMRATRRESLAKVYEKLWVRLGTKGDIAHFLGR